MFPLQVQLTQTVVNGVNTLINMEKRLEKGEDIEDLLPLKLQANVPASPAPGTPTTTGEMERAANPKYSRRSI